MVSGRRNIRVLLEYDGVPFHGWQVQPGCLTIQEALQEALARITGEKTVLRASGRTDAGVHALGQVANFFTRSGLAPDVFRRALNSLAPPGITVLEAQEVDSDFDSQHRALGKVYRYCLFLRDTPSALQRKRSWHVRYRLNIHRMRAAGSCFIGKRDFSSFRSAGCTARDPVRNLRHLEIRRRRRHLTIELEGNGFLRHMVRNIVGTLVDVGRGRIGPEEIPAILEARRRSLAGVAAPPFGLYLVSVTYPPPYRWPEPGTKVFP